MLADSRTTAARVAATVDYDGAGTDGPAVLMPLDRAQPLLGRTGKIRHVLVSNRGGETSGAGLTNRVVAPPRRRSPRLDSSCRRSSRTASARPTSQATSFVSVFTTFGSFSIAAGILLIFLIFVMLSAERRSELGIARAIGTRREHLVQLFVFEGLAYDLGAALVGAALGVGVAFAMVAVMANAFDTTGVDVQQAVTLRSLVVAYALGVLLTLVVVTASAWRVSRLNIVSAVRGTPEPPRRRRSRRYAILAIGGLVLGALLAATGLSANQATPFAVGISIAVMSLIPLAKAMGFSERVAYTVAGAVLVTWWLLPFKTMNAIAGRHLDMDFSAWTISGLMVVAGITWVIVYNADVVLGLGMRLLGRIRGLAPVLKMAMAYPLRGRFRTGITLAMFTLVVFTIVVGATTSRAFLAAVDDVDGFSGGFDVRAEVAPGAPLADPGPSSAPRAGCPRSTSTSSPASPSCRPRPARPATRPRGLSRPRLRPALPPAYEYGLAALARGYETPRQVWSALAAGRISPSSIRSRSLVTRTGTSAPPPDFRLRGFFLEDKVFDPVRVEVRDPLSGTTRR